MWRHESVLCTCAQRVGEKFGRKGGRTDPKLARYVHPGMAHVSCKFRPRGVKIPSGLILPLTHNSDQGASDLKVWAPGYFPFGLQPWHNIFRRVHAAAHGTCQVARSATWPPPSSFPRSGASNAPSLVRIGPAVPALFIGHLSFTNSWRHEGYQLTTCPQGMIENWNISKTI